MTSPSPDQSVARTDPPTAADEAATLLAFLAFHRATLRSKCAGLTPEQLATPLPTSPLTLAGLLKHAAVVEAGWLNLQFAGGVERPGWLHEIDPEDDDWSFTTALGASFEQLLAWSEESAAVSERVVAEALAGPDGLDTRAVAANEDGTHPSLRWILVHLIGELARHSGHADLLREAIDGATGY